MKTVIETRNLNGEASMRTETTIASFQEAFALAEQTMSDNNISRVLIFEDIRPPEIDSIHHNPKYFILRFDAQRNIESGELEVIGDSWPQ